MARPLKGQCLCGGVRFEVDRRDLEQACACHCGQCRQFAGNYWTSFNAPLDGLTFTAGEDLIAWYRSSKTARRGFCRTCGASLFYNADGLQDRKHRISIALGAMERPTGLRLSEHIFVKDKGDYYDIADGLLQLDEE